MERLRVIDKRLNKLMPLITPSGVILALIVGEYFVGLKPLVNPLFGLMTLFGAMKISLNDMFDALKRPIFIITFALASYIAMPLLVNLISLIFFGSSPDIRVGYNLIRAIPTAVVGSIWAGIYHGNLAVSLTVLLLDTLLAPLFAPLSLRIFSGEAIEIDSIGMMQSLCVMVVIPFIIGLILNRLFDSKIKTYVTPVTNPLSKLILLFVVIINVSQVAERIKSSLSPSYLLIAVVAIIVAGIGFPVGHLLCRLFRLKRGETVAITFAVAMRNISAALVLAIDFLPAAAALPVIFSVVCQQTIAALMGHLYFFKED